jgi:hypothetical protein
VNDADEAPGEARCRHCGYTLEGLSEVGDCPECGMGYSEESRFALKPFPPRDVIVARCGWPLLAVIIASLVAWVDSPFPRVRAAAVCAIWFAFAIGSFSIYIFADRTLHRCMPVRDLQRPGVVAARAVASILLVLCATASLLTVIPMLMALTYVLIGSDFLD